MNFNKVGRGQKVLFITSADSFAFVRRQKKDAEEKFPELKDMTFLK
jgi:hypothetical protein